MLPVPAGLMDQVTAVHEAAKAAQKERTPKKIFLPPRLVNLANLNQSDVQGQLRRDLQRYLGRHYHVMARRA